MNKENNISDRKKEIILNKCINLISKGFSFKYCEIKFKKYQGMLEEYLPIIVRIKELERNNLGEDFLQSTLNKIYNDKSIKEIQAPNKSSAYKTHAILKPAIIFLSVLIFFSFSFASVAYASQNTIPGKFLYPVKRSVENLKLFIYPESKKNAIHFELLNNRLNEASILINSDTDEKTITNTLLEDIDKEFNQCKKYNYFGGKPEKEVIDLVNNIKDKYKDKFNQKKNQNEKKEDINSKKQENSVKNNSNINSKDETTTSKDSKGTSTETTENTKKIYNITSSCNKGGTISPDGNQSVDNGSDMTFVITPAIGYHIEYLRVDNDKLTNITTTYIFNNVMDNHTIHAHFAKNSSE